MRTDRTVLQPPPAPGRGIRTILSGSDLGRLLFSRGEPPLGEGNVAARSRNHITATVYFWKQILADSGNLHIQKRTPLIFVHKTEAPRSFSTQAGVLATRIPTTRSTRCRSRDSRPTKFGAGTGWFQCNFKDFQHYNPDDIKLVSR